MRDKKDKAARHISGNLANSIYLGMVKSNLTDKLRSATSKLRSSVINFEFHIVEEKQTQATHIKEIGKSIWEAAYGRYSRRTFQIDLDSGADDRRFRYLPWPIGAING